MTIQTRALITGVQGFTGRYMAAELARNGYDVVGLAHREVVEPIPGVRSILICDLADPIAVQRAVDAIQADVVVHLAAIAFVAHGDVEAIYRTNLIGSRNLLEALVRSSKKPRSILLASSANIYGNSKGGILDENVQPAPANDYAVSKLAMEYMARLYQDTLPLTIVRPFNYTGVGQSPSFLIPKIVNHVRRKAAVIELGNLDVARDFSDVRILVQYYRKIIESDTLIGQTVNVCSGIAYTLNEVIDLVRCVSGHDFDIHINPDFVRANEVPILIGNPQKLIKVVGEIKKISFVDTLEWMINSPS
jgi:nucleoside-diphosphate-sugar epimerase